MGVSRGSFYWHFADIGAFHAAILKHWREVAAEQIIADLEAAAGHADPMPLLLRRVFGEQAGAGERGAQLGRGRPAGARRGAGDRPAPAELCREPAQGLRATRPRWRAPARKFSIGRFSALRISDRPLPKARQQAVLDELLRIALRQIAAPLTGCVKEMLDRDREYQAGDESMSSPPERLEGTVDPKLLEILVCPLTKGPLEYDAARQELISRSAKLAYPIRDGIPIMLPEEARKIE